jgi:hypothetical protein
MERIADTSPRLKARVAGVFELLEGVGSSCGQVFILGSLIVTGNAAATASNILANQQLFWLGFAVSFMAVVFHIVWTLLFYDLFKPVNRSVARLAAAIMLVGCALQTVTCLLYLAPWIVLTGGSSLNGFTTDQIQALAYVFLKLNGSAFDAYLVFFGLWCLVTGYLILRSRFMPHILGVLLAIDGLGWMMFMVPSFGRMLFPFIAAASGVAEVPLMLWLLVVGVNEQRWAEQARVVREQ